MQRDEEDPIIEKQELEEQQQPLIMKNNISNNKIYGEWFSVFVPSTGQRQCYGISSSYSMEYPLQLKGIVDREEFYDIISRLNDTIRNFWPCNLCYLFGYGCSVCTCGLSVLCPSYCMSYSEQYAVDLLRNITLKAKFYERKISFTIQKSLCNSYVEIKFPSHLLEKEEEKNNPENLKEDNDEEDISSETNTLLKSQDDRSPWVVLAQPPKKNRKEL